MRFDLLVPCASGLEGLVGKEIRHLGYDCQVENGAVRLVGNEHDIAKLNLHLRIADRVKIIMGTFKATTFDELYAGVRKLAWQDILPMDANFPVSGRSIRSSLHAVPSCQSITKKAIVDKMKQIYHRQGKLPESGASYPVEVSIRKNKAMLTVDTTGDSLFKRGYRLHKGPAPLKENMAAALLALTTWFPNRPFADPTCGSGTIPIEAARWAMNIAPGLNRTFLCEDWRNFPAESFEELREQAKGSVNHDIELDILAADIDHRMIAIAEENAKKAGVHQQIHFKQMQVADFTTDQKFGIMLCNPPYGERLENKDSVHKLYRTIGNVFRPMTTWSKYILTSDLKFEDYYGAKATKRRKLYNGKLRTDLFQFWGDK